MPGEGSYFCSLTRCTSTHAGGHSQPLEERQPLEDTVTTLKEALKEIRRPLVPLDWAVPNTFGFALAKLVERRNTPHWWKHLWGTIWGAFKFFRDAGDMPSVSIRARHIVRVERARYQASSTSTRPNIHISCALHCFQMPSQLPMGLTNVLRRMAGYFDRISAALWPTERFNQVSIRGRADCRSESQLPLQLQTRL